MLKTLKVKNFAIVEETVAEFSSGLNVITGETGAGKSVLMSALAFVLGGRADSTSVRDGAREAEVEAEFDNTILRRTLTAEGRSRAWVDEESVTIAELKAKAAQLAEINGPSAAMRLADESVQRATLDQFVLANVGEKPFADYSQSWAEFSNAEKALAAIEALGTADPEAIELLKFQIDELEAANLTEEDETLPARHAASAHAEEIASAAGKITEALGGDEGASTILSSIQPRLSSIARHLPQAAEWSSEIEDLTVRLNDLSRTISEAASSAAESAEELASLDARMTLLNKLKRKYLLNVCEDNFVVQLLQELELKKDKLESFESRDEKLTHLRLERDKAKVRVLDLGSKLTKVRLSEAKKLSSSVVSELRGLGFLRGDFSISISKGEPSQHGCDIVAFEFAPNPGEAHRHLSAIASSGEMARVALALRAASPHGAKGESLNCPVLIFDEIDANIGGEVGTAVGDRLHAVSSERQVIAITHLPQTAVCGDRHIVVSKSVSGGRTRSCAEAVSGESRVSEIARMLGGEKITSVVRKHAKELLGI